MLVLEFCTKWCRLAFYISSMRAKLAKPNQFEIFNEQQSISNYILGKWFLKNLLEYRRNTCGMVFELHHKSSCRKHNWFPKNIIFLISIHEKQSYVRLLIQCKLIPFSLAVWAYNWWIEIRFWNAYSSLSKLNIEWNSSFCFRYNFWYKILRLVYSIIKNWLNR